jgi:hypothetical protein
MGVRVVVHEWETVGHALFRLKEQILADNRWPVFELYSHKKSPQHYQKPSTLKRRRRWVIRINRRGGSVKGFWFVGRACYHGH